MKTDAHKLKVLVTLSTDICYRTINLFIEDKLSLITNELFEEMRTKLGETLNIFNKITGEY